MECALGKQLTCLVSRLATFFHCRSPKDVSLLGNNKVQSFRHGDFDNLGCLYAILSAFNRALADEGGLRHNEAEKAFRLAVKHLADRRTGMDTFSNPVTMRRACGLAKLMARSVSDLERQVHIEQPPTDLNISIENLFAWIEESLADALPVLVMLDGESRQFVVIQGIDDERLYLSGDDRRQSIERDDCAVRRGLVVLSATNMFRVRVLKLEPLFEIQSRFIAFGHRLSVHG